jgi:hypothetical protein
MIQGRPLSDRNVMGLNISAWAFAGAYTAATSYDALGGNG